MSYQKCPVCEGRQTVPAGFYDRTVGAPGSGTAPEKCRTCGGTGMVGSEDRFPFRDPSLVPYGPPFLPPTGYPKPPETGDPLWQPVPTTGDPLPDPARTTCGSVSAKHDPTMVVT